MTGKRKGMGMNPATPKGRESEIHRESIHLVSIFVSWFLRKERLEQDGPLGQWLKTADKIDPPEWGPWAAFTRRALMNEALPTLGKLLERPTSESESRYLAGR